MRVLFITAFLSTSTCVCFGQVAVFGEADFYRPRWQIDAESGPEKNTVEYENIMLEGLLLKEHIEDIGWKEADKYCRETLKLYSDHMYLSRLEQEVAFRMLYIHLLSRPLNEEQKEVLGFYLDLLLLNNTPDAYTVYQCLQVLQSSWSPERIREAADQTYKSGKKWLAMPSAQIEIEEGMPRSRDVGTVRIWNMQQSLPKLNSLLDL